MNDFTMPLLLDLDVVSLTMSLVNISSATGEEAGLADSVEDALRSLPHLTVERTGSTVVASTTASDPATGRVLVAGHLDTVAGAADALATVEMGKLSGPGACDVKGGLAVMLRAAASARSRDTTFVFYGSDLADVRPELLDVEAAVVLAPTSGTVSTTQPDHPALARLIAIVDAPGAPTAHPGRRDIEALASRGIPIAAFGPGDPALARSSDEFVPTAELTQCEFVLRTWLEGADHC